MDWALLAQAAPPLPGNGELTRGLAAVGVVLALLAVGAWAMRRGALGAMLQRKARGPVRIETTVPLGDRRSLMVVAVEGRRLLLGLTPVQVSFVTELERGEAFDAALSRATASSGSSGAAFGGPGAHTTP
jgi:flagellar protein FliO/FliZ